MVAGNTTVQQVLDAVSEQIASLPWVEASYSTDIEVINRTPTVILSWFSDIDTEIVHGSDQLWTINAKATLYAAPIRGNKLVNPIKDYNDKVMELVDLISVHPQKYPYGSAMSNLTGVDRVNVVRIRPAEFGLQYAGGRYFGVEAFIDIKLHRRIDY